MNGGREEKRSEAKPRILFVVDKLMEVIPKEVYFFFVIFLMFLFLFLREGHNHS